MPEIEWEGEEEEEEEKKQKTSTSKTINLDKGINDDYRNLLENKGFEMPSKLLQSPSDVDDTTQKVSRAETYIQDHSTKKGQPLQKLMEMQTTTFECNKTELPYMKDYLTRLEHIRVALKYMGEGVRRYKQPKRNAYKIQDNNQCGGLLMKLNAYRGE